MGGVSGVSSWRREDPQHVEGNGRWACEIPSEIL